jgi:hypothetical protein
MPPLLKTILFCAFVGWLLGAIAVRSLAAASAGAGYCGLIGLLVGCVRLAVSRSLRRHPVVVLPNSQPDQSDRLLVRALVILALAVSPILIAWIDENLSSDDPHWVRTLAAKFGFLVVSTVSIAVGAGAVWFIVRWFNHRDDLKRVKGPPEMP